MSDKIFALICFFKHFVSQFIGYSNFKGESVPESYLFVENINRISS